MNSLLKILLFVAAGVLISGCAPKYARLEPPSKSPEVYEKKAQKEESSESDDVRGSLMGSQELSKPQSHSASQPSVPGEISSQTVKQDQGKTKQKRMVAYDGTINSRSSKPDSLIAIAIAMTEKLKGYVEAQNNNSVTLRIPAAQFGVVYDSLLKLGVVIDFQRSAEDITDAYRDNDLRVTVLEKTIERYTKLLRLVRNENDKIAILKEIERLSEELENLKVQKSTLALRASFAKIQYTVEQITTEFTGITKLDNIKGFERISSLDPLNPSRVGKMLDIKVPEGMVRLQDRNYWIAQSPTGSRIWSGQIENEPSGTADFWINAITCKLRGQFLSVDTSSYSGYRSVRCTPQPGVNYRYTVSVKVSGNAIQIIQCYYPDELQEKRYFDSVKKTLAAQGGKS